MDHMMAPYALVMLRRDNKIAMVHRSPHSKFGADLHGLIGGAVEKNETFRQAAVREAFEEAGVTIDEHDLHFVHVFSRRGAVHELVACIFACDVWHGEAYNKEPDRHVALDWFSLDKLPEKIIPAHRGALQLIAQGIHYSEQIPDSVK